MELLNKNIKAIDNLNCEEIKIYTAMSEPQLLHYYEPDPGLFIAESPMIIERAMDAGYEAESFLVDGQYLSGFHSADNIIKVLNRAEKAAVYTAPLNVIKNLTGYTITRGLLAAMRRKTCIEAEKILENSTRIAVLEDVMNPTNLGAIFRSAAALGIDGILLTKACTDPLYRRAARVSMGTVFQLPWTFVENWYAGEDTDSQGHPGIELLHRHGYTTAAMALKDDSVSLKKFNPDKNEKAAFLLGSEGPGLRNETIDACDITVKIPMYHGVDSLNVAAASAIAFWQIMR